MSSRRKHGVAGVALSLLLVLAVAASCSPRIVESVRTEFVYRDREVRDSLYFRDSIYVKEQVKGDTVYLDKYVCKYIYKDRYRTDTLLREVRDTTFCEVKVEKPLSKMQTAKIGAFWWLLGAVIALLAWIFRKPILNLLKICL